MNAMMLEMYEWYMDNLFPEHRKQAIKHAEKDGRDRKKRLARGIQKSAVSFLGMTEEQMIHFGTRMFTRPFDGDYSGLSKWERIGSPFTASVVDWGIIINPYGWTNPAGVRMKWRAATRQYDRIVEYSN